MFKKYFMKKYALSATGADNLIKGALTRCLANLSLMLPMMLAFTFLYQFFHKLLGKDTLINLNLLTYLLISVGSLVVMYFVAKLSYKYCYTTIYEESAKSRITLAETLRKLPLSYFGQKDLADLSATIMSDATLTEKLFSHAIPHVYGAVLSTAILMIMLFINNWQMSLALFWLVPFSLFIFTVSRKQQRKVFQAGFVHEREVIEQIQDNFELIQEIKAYNQEEKFIQSMNNKLDKLKKIKIKTDFTVGVFLNLAYTFLKLGIASTAFCGAYLLAQGNIDIFTYLVFIIISGSIYSPIMEILDNLAILLFVEVIVDRAKEIHQLPQQDGSTNFDPKNYDITFENVNFSYLPGFPTLKNVSFTAKQGEVTALVGPSGGGKSSTAKCAARFWDIDSGKITLGGIDISQIDPETLLKKYSIVFQDVVLFNSSILENIRLGKKDATDEQVKQAAKLAQCEEFITRLPQGYNTLIGENGERLSGGERQRISIARALLKDAPIILMDEATASLDAENETLIQTALSELIKDKTVIIIAHRMRTVINANKIMVIKDGEIVEQGTAKQLLTQNGFFKNMYQIQNNPS